jgi:hypothetical protein
MQQQALKQTKSRIAGRATMNPIVLIALACGIVIVIEGRLAEKLADCRRHRSRSGI